MKPQCLRGGAGRGQRDEGRRLYYCGTGIGGGVLSAGSLVHGLLHPEIGHMLLRPHPDDPNPRGVCPYHDGCLEGLAAGPAIGARVGGDARALPDSHPTFVIEAFYLAQMCVNLILPQPAAHHTRRRVMERKACFHCFARNPRAAQALCAVARDPQAYRRIYRPPALFPVSGLIGAYLLGSGRLRKQGNRTKLNENENEYLKRERKRSRLDR